jgi:hypothetical protein
VDLRGRVSMAPDPDRLLHIQLSRKYDADPGEDAPGRHRVIVRMAVDKAAGHAA